MYNAYMCVSVHLLSFLRICQTLSNQRKNMKEPQTRPLRINTQPNTHAGIINPPSTSKNQGEPECLSASCLWRLPAESKACHRGTSSLLFWWWFTHWIGWRENLYTGNHGFPIKCRGLILQFFPWTNPVIYCSISVLGGLCHMKCTDWNRWNNIIYGNN
jgi:hypothetical protein